VAGALDELAHGDERGGQVEVEQDDGSVAVGHPAELAVTVHAGVGASTGQRRPAWMGAGTPLRAIWPVKPSSLRAWRVGPLS
jgi:hypothetical protein